ncbi:MAG: hypothetical protein ACYC99_05345 [Candidatus Geothermincolia bacterium]
MFIAFVVAAVGIAGCGGGGSSGKADESNYAARQSVVEALKSDRELDQGARDAIAAMSANAIPFQQGMDTLTGQTKTLLALIADVAARPRATNRYLSMAQTRVESYLRDRVFQIESTLGAQSPPEAQATYESGKATLDRARNDVRGMLFKYDPTLEKTVP